MSMRQVFIVMSERNVKHEHEGGLIVQEMHENIIVINFSAFILVYKE